LKINPELEGFNSKFFYGDAEKKETIRKNEMHLLQEGELLHPQIPKNDRGKVRVEKVLQMVQETYPS